MNKDYLLTGELMHWFYGHYMKNLNDKNNPLAMPLSAKDFSKLPPAFIVTAKYDPLRDDGTDYAEKLKQAGIKVKITCYEDMNHGFILYGGVCPAALHNIKDIVNNFKNFWDSK
jgi:acetyl esterase